ncbi:PTS sugar transporter subunit IIA [Agromyces seonyuensis]|uniref:Ascorbate-specific PTS system EIIA component n=1 Tax=Agromyces seonyuensis TaxID=2662446 RepID=A0A6I4NY77_9MICO|nr:PTS sugar transporter subunit IIA [Agromyces seonyuensis]MWB99253.1 PTS sugar transporter subunit IIA [Agromyces seonyuensis]
MTAPVLPDSAVEVGAVVGDWRGAVAAAGAALVRSGATSEGYTARMIAVVDELGPYIVVAPGLALAHARPGADVRHEGFAVVTLARPVDFGSVHNDPVRVVVALASTGADAHVAHVAALANAFNDPAAVDRLAAARSADEVRAFFGAVPAGNGTEETR